MYGHHHTYGMVYSCVSTERGSKRLASTGCSHAIDPFIGLYCIVLQVCIPYSNRPSFGRAPAQNTQLVRTNLDPAMLEVRSCAFTWSPGAVSQDSVNSFFYTAYPALQRGSTAHLYARLHRLHHTTAQHVITSSRSCSANYNFGSCTAAASWLQSLQICSTVMPWASCGTAAASAEAGMPCHAMRCKNGRNVSNRCTNDAFIQKLMPRNCLYTTANVQSAGVTRAL
ncbi:hypothetical protein COO60DRAFT_402776 [Scenedesmus sp. NREL 46B-D3]|nr:hypothetical protein COO60DRAFT_402776 [Scenedesmus sp. NREL 46B-D3]